MLLFEQMLIILLATKLAGDLSVRLHQPAVLGKLIIGILIGPAVLNLVQDSEMIRQISEIGVLLLMFMAGLETDIHALNENRRSALAVAVGGVILPILGGYTAGRIGGMDFQHAIFFGLLLSATSVSISVQTLKELGQLQSRESMTILGAALIDDILVVLALAVMMGFLTSEQISLTLVMGTKILFFASVILCGWKAVPWVMERFSTLKVSETVVSAALIICFAFAYAAELTGVAGIIGAFAAGIAISQTGYKEEVENKVQPIAYAFFVPVFFVSVGLSVRFQGIGSQIGFIIGVTLLAILTKLIGAGFGAKITGFNYTSAVKIGAGMVSRGEVALILAALGLETQLLSQEYFTACILVIILTTLASPPLLKNLFQQS